AGVRPGRGCGEEGLPRRFRIRTFIGAPIDRLERSLLDWRLHELGRQSEPARDVVLVGVDDETLANAREDSHPDVSVWPWPRALLGGLVGQIGREGGSPVLLDWALDSGRPRAGGEVPDDEQFRRALDATPGTVLGFSVSAAPPPAVVRPLRPSLVLVATEESDGPAVTEILRRVLASHAPAFAVPEGARVRVWAG